MIKNNFLRGIIAGFIFTLLISSICYVTYYGLEYAIASSIDVFAVNLVFMIVSALIVFFLKKLRVDDKIALITNILLIIFGILVEIGIFYEKISEIITITINYGVTGPQVKIPNIFWLIVLLCVTIRNVCTDENQKHRLLKFIIGELIGVVILIIVHIGLGWFIDSFNNALEVNRIINSVIQGICGILIVVYSLYMAKKCIDSIDNRVKR